MYSSPPRGGWLWSAEKSVEEGVDRFRKTGSEKEEWTKKGNQGDGVSRGEGTDSNHPNL